MGGVGRGGGGGGGGKGEKSTEEGAVYEEAWIW